MLSRVEMQLPSLTRVGTAPSSLRPKGSAAGSRRPRSRAGDSPPAKSWSKAIEEKKATVLLQSRAKQLEKAIADLRHGLRIVILHSQLDEEAEVPREQLQLVFARYQFLVAEDRNKGVQHTSDDEGVDAFEPDATSPEQLTMELGGRPKHRHSCLSLASSTEAEDQFELNAMLPAVSWHVLLGWMEQEVDFSRKADFKRSCSSVFRALKAWRALGASRMERKSGVRLSNFFQWMWPSSSCSDIADMFRKLGLHEITKLRQSTPRLIDADERRQLERVFGFFDSKGTGWCSPQDFAGGRNPDLATKRLTLVDAHTVRHVFGADEISLDDFLEFMSEAKRGHENVVQVDTGESGRRLIKSTREVLGFIGWLFEDQHRGEHDAQRRLVDALEAEVLKWEELQKLEVAAQKFHTKGGTRRDEGSPDRHTHIRSALRRTA